MPKMIPTSDDLAHLISHDLGEGARSITNSRRDLSNDICPLFQRTTSPHVERHVRGIKDPVTLGFGVVLVCL